MHVNMIFTMVMSIANVMFAVCIMTMAIVPCHGCQQDSSFETFTLPSRDESALPSLSTLQHRSQQSTGGKQSSNETRTTEPWKRHTYSPVVRTEK
jgi:hypothetical protein